MVDLGKSCFRVSQFLFYHLNCNSDQDILPINKDACVKENIIYEDQSFEELKKWIANEIKGNKILKNDNDEIIDVE